MNEVTVQVELLLNNKIIDRDGRALGHLEEIIAEAEGNELFVQEYHTGGYGMLEHLSAITIGAWLLRLVGRHPHGYVIKWHQLDLSDPKRPQLTCPRRELGRRS